MESSAMYVSTFLRSLLRLTSLPVVSGIWGDGPRTFSAGGLATTGVRLCPRILDDQPCLRHICMSRRPLAIDVHLVSLFQGRKASRLSWLAGFPWKEKKGPGGHNGDLFNINDCRPIFLSLSLPSALPYTSLSDHFSLFIMYIPDQWLVALCHHI